MFDLASIGLPPEGVLVDIGASTGEFFREAAAVMRPTRSLCVEMLGDLAGTLQKNPLFHNAHDGRCVVHCACGAFTDTVDTWRTMFHQSSSLLPCIVSVGKRLGHDMTLVPEDEQETVFVITLDSLCRKFGIDHIDLLKIDVQGYESRVLRGAKNILRHTDRVIIEILLSPHYEGQSDPEEIRSLLNDAGLRFRRELHRDCFPDTGEVLEVDELWERA